MAQSIDVGTWVPQVIAEQCEQYRSHPPVDWLDVQGNVTYLIEQHLLAGNISETEARKALDVYNAEIEKLGGPTVTWEKVFNKSE